MTILGCATSTSPVSVTKRLRDREKNSAILVDTRASTGSVIPSLRVRDVLGEVFLWLPVPSSGSTTRRATGSSRRRRAERTCSSTTARLSARVSRPSPKARTSSSSATRARRDPRRSASPCAPSSFRLRPLLARGGWPRRLPRPHAALGQLAGRLRASASARSTYRASAASPRFRRVGGSPASSGLLNRVGWFDSGRRHVRTAGRTASPVAGLGPGTSREATARRDRSLAARRLLLLHLDRFPALCRSLLLLLCWQVPPPRPRCRAFM